MPQIKVKYADYREGGTVSLAEYVQREVQGPMWHGDGVLEDVQAELRSTREYLERLIIVMGEFLSVEQITRVLGLEDARANGTHVVLED